MTSLNGKVAIVTGGARGMGAATSRLFAQAGARVVIADLVDTEGEAVARELGEQATYRHHDVSDEDSWQALVAAALARWGQIDVLVNNAGVLLYKAVLDTSKAEFEKVLGVNLIGSFLGIRAVAPHMTERKQGAIVNVSSAAGMTGTNGLAAYGSSKWGLRGLTRVSAMELGPSGIRVNSVHPGSIDTVMGNPGGLSKSEINRNHGGVPLQRIGDADEVARLSLFLASDAASYLSGAEIAVDGGLLAGQYYQGTASAAEATR